jgi:hypothetical protein
MICYKQTIGLSNMSRIYSAIQDFLKASDWKGIEDAEQGTIGLNYTGKNGAWTCIAHAREAQEQVVFYSIAPVQIAPEQRTIVGELVHRVNFGMIIGNFEYDLDDGEIRYKTSFDAQDTTLTNELIKPLVIANLVTMDKYLPSIRAVMAGTKPVAALELAEKG